MGALQGAVRVAAKAHRIEPQLILGHLGAGFALSDQQEFEWKDTLARFLLPVVAFEPSESSSGVVAA